MLKPVQAVIIIAEAESNGKVPFSKWALFGSHHILLFVQGFCNESNLKFYCGGEIKVMKESVFSICGMCTVRCPIQVEVEDGVVKWIEGNPQDPGMAGRLCAKGSAGLAMLYDYERPQHPMIREGKRGEGKWKKATWDEALDYIAKKLKAIIKKDGARSNCAE